MARSVLDASDVIDDILRDSDSDLSELSESEYEHVDDMYDDEVHQASDDDANQSPAAVVVAEWERNDDADAYVPIWCPLYAKSSDPELPDSRRRSKPIDCFDLLFPKPCFKLMCEITNLYALQYFDCPNQVPETSCFNNWFDCTIDKTNLHMLMGYVRNQVYLTTGPSIVELEPLGSRK